MASPKKEKKEYVAHTVVKVLSDKEEHTLTGIGMEGVFRVLLGFLLFNQLLTHQSLIFFTDGAKNIRSNINKFFSFRPFRIILDWYHLDKKCGEHLSLGIQGTQKRNQVWEALRRVLWVGDVQAARTYLKGLDMRFIKSKDWIEKLDAYLERNTDFIPCYAVRAELGLKNSSNAVEKANDLIVAQRQKHNGMSWSPDGSGASASIRAALVNGELSYWLKHQTMPFTMHTHISWTAPVASVA